MTAEPRRTTERLREAAPCAVWENREWQSRFEGLVAGITAAGPEADFGLATAASPARLLAAHEGLARRLGFPLAAAVRQVHGARVARLETGSRDRPMARRGRSGAEAGGAHLHVAGRADGLVAAGPGILLTITAADCVPVYLVDPEAGVLGLLHAGWRGIAAGVLEAGVRGAREAGADPASLWLHLGPAICGACYEVGPEVPEALGLEPGSGTVDLRRVLAERVLALGIAPERLTVSTWCTRCGSDRFHSHRGSRGTAGRMAAYLGRRVEPPGEVAGAAPRAARSSG